MTFEQSMSRRRFLRAAGVSIALPFLPSLFPGRAFADGNTDPAVPPRRMIFISVPLGFIPNPWIQRADFVRSGQFTKSWMPDDDGPGYKMPETHASLEPFRGHISFLKGLCHQMYRGDSHHADEVFLTGADTMADPSRAFVNTISCDQVAAASPALANGHVRYPSLVLGIRARGMGTSTGSLSWTANGTPMTPIISAPQLFDRLFGKDDVPKEMRLARLADQRSMLDVTLDQVADMNRSLNPSDQRKLDEVTSAVRAIEKDIQREEAWLDIPKPEVGFPRPSDGSLSSAAHCATMLKLAHAAFLTDSTRIITYELSGEFNEFTKDGKHSLAHAGTQQLALEHEAMDQANSDLLAGFLKMLNDSPDHDGKSLLHHSCGVLGSGCWGPHHGMRCLPALCFGHAGGRLKHGATHKLPDPTPLANLWLTMLRACGVEASSFADSTGEIQEIKS